MMKNILISFLLFSAALGAQQPTPLPQVKDTLAKVQQPAGPEKCKVGVYVTSIFDFSLSDKSYSVDFWMWFNYADDSLKPLGSAELVNSKEYSYSLQDEEKKNGINWATQKCRATVKKDWDIHNFPFDRQSLTIDIEDANMDISQLEYVADTENSKYDKRIKIDGWKITGFDVAAGKSTYETTYGDPELKGTSTYPQVEISFTIEREGSGLFFKLFTGVYVAYCISLLVFVMGPENAERFGLLVGGLFAAIGNKYIVDGLLPQTTMFTLVDKIHVLTFSFILLHLILTVIVWKVNISGDTVKAKRLDKMGFRLSLLSYIALNVYLIVMAL
jgi:hypothetical protein